MSTATTTAAALQQGAWSIDPVHSAVGYRVRHFGLTWLKGGFEQFELAANVTEDGSISLTGSTPVDAITFTNEQLKGHLMSPDFFDAQLHPTLTFASTDVQLADDGAATVTGELTLKGITKQVVLSGTWAAPTQGLGGDTRFGLDLAGEIDRHDFDVSWSAQLPSGADVLGRTVKLEGQFELVLQ